MWLDGIRVVDFTTLLPGPYATLRLVELGAEVTKVEPPNGGDPARYTGPQISGTGAVFLAHQRNKSSVVLDLKDEADRNAAWALIDAADVLVEGFRPGVMERLGLDAVAVRARNPGIVYCSLTGYGQTGPLAELAGHDLNYMSVSGVLSQFCDEHGQPTHPSLQLADLLGGIVASEAILAALVNRSRTRQGSYIDVSMTDALAGLLTNHALMQQALGLPRGVPELNGSHICYHIYQTKDAGYVSLAALEPKFWRRFCEAVERPSWVSQQFAAAVDGESVYEEIRMLFQSRSRSEWAVLGRAADCCLQPVLDVAEFLASEHASARGIRIEAAGPVPDAPLVQVRTHAGGHRNA